MKFWLCYLGLIAVLLVVMFGIPTLMSAKNDLAVGMAIGIMAGTLGIIVQQVYKKLTK